MANLKTNVKISDDTINMIAGIAATSIDGVSSLGEGTTFNMIPFIESNNLKKGIEIKKNESDGSITVKLTITIKEGIEIKNTCRTIQEKVKESIESMLDMKVREVIIRVAKLDDV